MSAALRFVAMSGLVLMASCSTVRFGDRMHADAPPPAKAPVTAQSAPTATTTPWSVFGHSVEGRPLRRRELGTGPIRVLWIGGIHGDETEGALATEELPAAFLADPLLVAAVTLTLVEDLNPDGRAAGTRRNARGVDLNRNYPANNYRPGGDRGGEALCEPEARALSELVRDLHPALVMVMHSWGRRPTGPSAFVNFDGPATAVADVFSGVSGYPVVPSEDIHGTPGSLGSWIGIDMGIPILTVEYERGRDPRLCWEQTRAAILAVLRDVASRDRG